MARDGSAICTLVAERVGEDFAHAHRSRPLTAEVVNRSGLILTASKTERAAVARLDPSARARTFTLREAAALAGSWSPDGSVDLGSDVDEGPFERFAATIHARRGLTSPPPRETRPGLRGILRRRPAGDPVDIADGHVLSGRQHHLALDEVASTVDSILGALRAPVS